MWLRTEHLLAVSFWFDEACSWRISQFDLPELMSAVQHDAHPPFFYLLQKGWQWVWGTSLLSARSLSVCCGLGGVAAMLFLGRGDRTRPGEGVKHQCWLPWGAAGCLAASPLQVVLSQQARPYALVVLLGLVSALFLLKALDRPWQLGSWLAFTTAGLLLTWTHYIGLFLLPGLFLFAFYEVWRDRKDLHLSPVRCLGLGGSLILLQLVWWSWLPVFQFQCERTLSRFWLPALTWSRWQEAVAAAVTGRSLHAALTTGDEIVSWLAVPVWCGLPALAGCSGSRTGRLAAWGTLFPLLAVTAFSCWVRNLLEPRVLCLSQAFLSLAVMVVVARIDTLWGQLACLGAVTLALIGLGCEYSLERNWHASHAGLRQAVDCLNEVRQAGEPVLVSSPFLFPSIVTQLRFPDEVWVAYRGDHRSDVLIGPPLLRSDYDQSDSILENNRGTIWTVDAELLFGEQVRVSVPDEYLAGRQWRFAESFGIPMEVLVRRYDHPDSHSQ